MSIGGSSGNIPGTINGVNTNFYQPSKIAPNPKVGTLLPPNGEVREIEIGKKSGQNKFSFTSTFGKVKSYFKRIGFALLGMDNHEMKVNFAKFQAPEAKLNSPASQESDPVVGSWPANFQKEVPLPTNPVNNSQNYRDVPNESFEGPGNEFNKLLSEIKLNQSNQQNLMNWIQ
ncbi:MAG: hypothetical protein QNJ31_05470 [Candidatus Caenarcaniphilales bacterium]|nr:hypothetical protein [Candidatus Caenarcaniphilales bacterium]